MNKTFVLIKKGKVNRLSHIILFSLLFFFSFTSYSQIVYDNRVFSPLIKTVVLEQQGNFFSEPVIYLNSYKKLLLQFDELTEETFRYEYSIIHCNSDWTQSDLDVNLYMEGFETQPIEHHQNSFNTIQRYVHYSQTIPSSNMKLLKSGNYIIKVFKADNPEEVILTRRFYCVEDITNIRTEVRQSSLSSQLKTHQEVNVKVSGKNNRFFQNPSTYMKVFVQQNGREDTKRQLRLRGQSGIDIDFSFDESNQFFGGNEFRHFDITSLRTRSTYVAGFDFLDNQNLVYLREEKIKKTLPYSTEKDINGKFNIRNEYNEDKNTYSDYAWVRFTLPLPYTLEGNYYVVGGLSDWRMTEQNKFQYDNGKYYAYLYLKQGYYNYQILFVPNGDITGSYREVEGNHYETNNTYKVFVYYHNFSDNYDELIGFSSAEYR